MKNITRFLTLLTLLVVFQNVSSTLSDLESLRQAAEKGEVAAQFQLGTIYYTGQDVPRDFKEAAEWYRKVAEQGFAAAQHNLGIMYSRGEGVPQNHEIAFGWYRKAAEQGDSRSQNNLGNLYRTGQGIPKNDKEAVKWYRKAAEQGYVIAQYNLGVAYNRGEGIFQDENEAIKWYRKAAEQGYVEAQRELRYLEKTPSTLADNVSTTFPVDISSAQSLPEVTKEPLEPVTEPASTPAFNNNPQPTAIEPVDKFAEKSAVTQPIETSTPAISSTPSFNNNRYPNVESVDKQTEKFAQPIETSTPAISSTPSFNNNRYPTVSPVEKSTEKIAVPKPTETSTPAITSTSNKNRYSTPVEKRTEGPVKTEPAEGPRKEVEKTVAVVVANSKPKSELPKQELSQSIISLNYTRKKDKPFMNQLANYLKEKGYRVDRIGRTYIRKVYKPQWDIRYYYDRKAAEVLKENINAFLQNVEGVKTVNIQIRDFSYLLSRQIKIKRGRIEVWILNPP
jgi:hypothetical protein